MTGPALRNIDVVDAPNSEVAMRRGRTAAEGKGLKVLQEVGARRRPGTTTFVVTLLVRHG